MSNDTERQRQLAAEMILDSEGLTDDLEDAAAKRLLSWGVAQAERLATQVAAQDLDRSVNRLRRLIKRVNNLAANRASLSDDELAAELDDWLAAASELLGGGAPTKADAVALIAGQDKLGDAALVERVTALLTLPHHPQSASLPAEAGEQSRQGQNRRGCVLQFWKRR